MGYDDYTIPGLVGLGLPLVISVINQRRWASEVKAVVALVVCAVTAAIVEALRGDLDWADWRKAFMIIAAAALGFYHVYWKNSRITDRVEAATSPGTRAGNTHRAETDPAHQHPPLP